mmetsp:Transcript_20045/g.37887  ORF Transcript_20045/g.37887 Transcript_20045/m.37887 type:complete len:311 (-) Transcript_20045:66-998(-)
MMALASEAPISEVPETMGDAFLKCRVASVSALRKKGHVLLDVVADDRVCRQVVTDRPNIAVGIFVSLALPGATVAGKVVKQQKIAGEWSEGMLVHMVEEQVEGAQETDTEALKETVELEDGDDVSQTSDQEAVSAVYQVLPTAGAALEVSPGNIYYVAGDASKAQYGKGNKIIAHVCNDHGRWGKGFVMALTDEWGKGPGKLYRKWHKAGAKAEFGLGRAQIVNLTEKLSVANIIGQNGIKTGSKGPPVRYDAIEEGFDAVCGHARKIGASVHMPRIGIGLAGGEWTKIESIINLMVHKHGVDVYVYDYN